MELTIGLTIVVILAVILMWFATKIIMKLLGFALVIVAILGVMYYFSWGPFEHHHIKVLDLNAAYCDEEGDEDICQCIIVPIMTDLEQRFDYNEMLELSKNEPKAFYAFMRSMEVTKPQSMDCLERRSAEEKYDEFLLELVPVKDETLKDLTEKASRWKDKLKKEYETLKEDKEEIDDRY